MESPEEDRLRRQRTRVLFRLVVRSLRPPMSRRPRRRRPPDAGSFFQCRPPAPVGCGGEASQCTSSAVYQRRLGISAT
jgi:hypothetical protein